MELARSKQIAEIHDAIHKLAGKVAHGTADLTEMQYENSPLHKLVDSIKEHTEAIRNGMSEIHAKLETLDTKFENFTKPLPVTATPAATTETKPTEQEPETTTTTKGTKSSK